MANSIEILINAKDNASKAVQKTQRNMESLTRAARGAGLAFTALSAVGVAAMGALTKGAIEQRQAEQLLRVAVENTGVSYDSIKDKIDETTAALQKKTNFGDEEQMTVLSQMIAIFGDVEKAMIALPVIMDAAASKGRALTTVAGTLSRALDGQVDTAITLGMQFDKTAGFMDRVDQVSGAVGGSAEALADPLTQLANDVGDLAQVFGKELLGPLEFVVTKMREWIIAMQEIDPVMVKVITGTGLVATAILGILGPILLAISFAGKLAPVFSFLGTVIATVAGVFSAVALLIAAAIAAVIGFGVAWAFNWKGIREKTKFIVGKIKEFLESGLGWLMPGGRLILGLINLAENWEEIWNRIMNFTKTITEKLGDMMRVMVEQVMKGITGLINVFNMIPGVPDINLPEGGIPGAAQGVMDKAKGVVSNVRQGLRDFGDIGVRESFGGQNYREMAASGSELEELPTASVRINLNEQEFGDAVGVLVSNNGQLQN